MNGHVELIELLMRCYSRISHRSNCETRKLRTMFLMRSKCTCGADDIERAIENVLLKYERI